jgi:predicted ATP-grasp superfamily ATP-dependent carboligase
MEGFMTTLFRIVRSRRYVTIFPMTEHSLLPISEHRDQLTPYLKIALPNHESIAKAIDKSQMLEVADELGIPTPDMFRACNWAEVKDISTRIQYPAVIKPRSFVRRGNGNANYSRPFYVNSPSELVSTYAKVNEVFPGPLIQEYVPGYNINVALLFDQGEPIAACFIKEDRTLPITGGTSVLRESVPPNPRLLRYASDLGRKLLWHGVVEMEFRVDYRDLTPKLMEVNPRFWGSLNVAIESGVDFPYLLYLLAKGEHVHPVFSYKSGVKFRWLVGDTQNLFSTLRDEQRLINVEPAKKLNAVLRFLKFYEKNIHYDGFTVFDPLPFFMDGTFFINENAKIRIRNGKRVLLPMHLAKQSYVSAHGRQPKNCFPIKQNA